MSDNNACRLNSVECYNVQTDNWSVCASMREARGAVRLGALNNILYAVCLAVCPHCVSHVKKGRRKVGERCRNGER